MQSLVGYSATDMAQRIRTHLTERHGQKDFTIVTQDEMLSSLDNILAVLTLGVAALGILLGLSILLPGLPLQPSPFYLPLSLLISAVIGLASVPAQPD